MSNTLLTYLTSPAALPSVIVPLTLAVFLLLHGAWTRTLPVRWLVLALALLFPSWFLSSWHPAGFSIMPLFSIAALFGCAMGIHLKPRFVFALTYLSCILLDAAAGLQFTQGNPITFYQGIGAFGWLDGLTFIPPLTAVLCAFCQWTYRFERRQKRALF